jgi:hypothetical protein
VRARVQVDDEGVLDDLEDLLLALDVVHLRSRHADARGRERTRAAAAAAGGGDARQSDEPTTSRRRADAGAAMGGARGATTASTRAVPGDEATTAGRVCGTGGDGGAARREA